jgi:D-glycero-alpha-D-manno-heptose-7-phosphate kinase
MNNILVRARAPLRLGLAGGGTDVSPYCDEYGGFVLNAAINRYAYAVINTIDEPVLKFAATDQNISVNCVLNDPLALDNNLNLHKAVYRAIIDRYNGGRRVPLELITFCDAPIGSGLGSSSTLVVVMIRAFVELFNLPLDDYAIAHLAFQIERVDCKLQGGRQDQYSATFGGVNFMEFYANDRAVINPLRIKSWIVSELESSLLLFFTGVSRESASIIAEQSENLKVGHGNALYAMHEIKREALVMKECLLKGDFPGIVESMQRGWKCKKQSARSVSNLHIEEVYDVAINAGALAGRVSGAGGGGFMMFFVPLQKRMDVIKSLDSFEGQVSNCHFTMDGSQAWRV